MNLSFLPDLSLTLLLSVLAATAATAAAAAMLSAKTPPPAPPLPPAVDKDKAEQASIGSQQQSDSKISTEATHKPQLLQQPAQQLKEPQAKTWKHKQPFVRAPTAGKTTPAKDIGETTPPLQTEATTIQQPRAGETQPAAAAGAATTETTAPTTFVMPLEEPTPAVQGQIQVAAEVDACSVARTDARAVHFQLNLEADFELQVR